MSLLHWQMQVLLAVAWLATSLVMTAVTASPTRVKRSKVKIVFSGLRVSKLLQGVSGHFLWQTISWNRVGHAILYAQTISKLTYTIYLYYIKTYLQENIFNHNNTYHVLFQFMFLTKNPSESHLGIFTNS